MPGTSLGTDFFGQTVRGSSLSFSKLVIVDSAADFPAASAGVRTLASDTAYLLTGAVDLNGDRLVLAGPAAVIGTSSETSFLTSTGLGASTPLVTSAYTLRFQNISIHDVGTAVSISGAGNLALDWDATNFVNVTTVGDIEDAGNFILTDSSFLDSQGLRFTGTIGTIGIVNSLLQGDGTTADDLLEVTASATVTRRIRLITCAVVAFGSTTGINVSASASVPDEAFILDVVSFSGGASYLPGLDYTSNKAVFVRCGGITNTTAAGNLYMLNNATATTFSGAGAPTKVLGTTVANALNQRFSHTTNRLTYTGAFAQVFRAQAVASVTGSANKVFGLYFAINGTVIPATEMYATLGSGGRAESIFVQGILSLSPGDYVEVWIENDTDSSSMTVEFLNAIIERASP